MDGLAERAGRLLQRSLGEAAGHEHDIGQVQLLVLARELGGAVERAGERAGPLRLALLLLLVDHMGGPPVADGQIIEPLQPALPGGGEGRSRAVFIRINGGKLLPAPRNVPGNMAVEGPVHGVDAKRAGFVRGQPRELPPAHGHANRLAPGVMAGPFPQGLRQRPAGQLAAERRGQKTVPRGIRVPTHARPVFGEQARLGQRQGRVPHVGIAGGMGE